MFRRKHREVHNIFCANKKKNWKMGKKHKTKLLAQ